MEDIAFKLLIAGAAPQTKVIERVQYLAGLIMQINRDFSNTNLSLRISMVNVFSTADELALRVSDFMLTWGTCGPSRPSKECAPLIRTSDLKLR